MCNKLWDTEKLFKEGFNTLPCEYIEWVQRSQLVGKTIQCRAWNDESGWINIRYPSWNWTTLMYRVNPEENKKLMTCRQLAEWLDNGK